MTRSRKKDGEWAKPKSHDARRESGALAAGRRGPPHSRAAARCTSVRGALVAVRLRLQLHPVPLERRARDRDAAAPVRDRTLCGACRAGAGVCRSRGTTARHGSSRSAFVATRPRCVTSSTAGCVGRRRGTHGDRRSTAGPRRWAPGYAAAAARLDHGGAFEWLTALRKTPTFAVPETARLQLLDALVAQPPPLAEAPAEMRIEVVDGTPHPRLRLTPDRSRSDRLLAEVSFEYEGTIVEASVTRAVVRAASGERAIRRDRTAEQRFDREPRAAGLSMGYRTWQYGEKVLRFPPSSSLAAFVSALLADGWRVEVEGRPIRRPGTPSSRCARASTGSSCTARSTFGGHRRRAARSCSQPSQRGEHDRPLRRRHARPAARGVAAEVRPLAGLGRSHGRPPAVPARAGRRCSTRCSPRSREVHWSTRPSRASARAAPRLRRHHRRSTPPATLHGQAARLPARRARLARSSSEQFGFGGCLADDMGLGKTVQVLALLDGRARGAAAQTTGGRRSSSCRARWCSTGSRRPRVRAGPARARPHRRRRARKPRDDFADVRPGPDHLRHAAPRRRAARRTSRSTTSSSTRRRRSRTRDSQSAKAARLLRGAAPPGAQRHAGREPPRRAVEPVRVPQPRHARRRARCFELAGRRARSPDAETRELLARGAAAVHPAPHEGAGRAGAAGEDRADALLRAGAARSASSTTSCATTTAQRCSAASSEQGIGQVEDAGPRGAAAPAPGGLPPGPVDEARSDEPSAKLDVLLPQLDEVRRRRAQGAGLLAVHQPARASSATRLDERRRRLRVPRRQDARPRRRASSGSRTTRTAGCS